MSEYVLSYVLITWRHLARYIAVMVQMWPKIAMNFQFVGKLKVKIYFSSFYLGKRRPSGRGKTKFSIGGIIIAVKLAFNVERESRRHPLSDSLPLA